MNMKQKRTYMLIGCLFTLAGTVISNLTNIPTQAQDEKKAVFDKIVCKELEIVTDDGTSIKEKLVTKTLHTREEVELVEYL